MASHQDFQRQRNQSDTIASCKIGTLIGLIKEAVGTAIADTSPTSQSCCSNLTQTGMSTIDERAASCYVHSSPDVVFPCAPQVTLSTTGGCRTLTLVSDVLEYTEHDVPEPPAGIGLTIERLSAIWDDSWSDWKNTSPLIIKGRPVPLKHLRKVYTRSSHWRYLKQQWSLWNVSYSSPYSIVLLLTSFLFDESSSCVNTSHWAHKIFGQNGLCMESGAHHQKFWLGWPKNEKTKKRPTLMQQEQLMPLISRRYFHTERARKHLKWYQKRQ